MKMLAALGIWLVMAAGALAAPVHPSVRTEHNLVELTPQTTAAAPGGTLYVALHQTITSGWHTYWRNPGDAGQATSLTWTLPAGWKAGDIVWPTPERDQSGPIMNYVLTGDVYLPVAIEVPASAKPGETVTLKAAVSWLVCKDVCIPEDATLTLTLPVTAGTPTSDPQFGGPISDTIAAAPKAVGLDAHYQVSGTAVKLGVVGPQVRGVDVAHAYFFPYDGTVLDQAKPQMVERGADGVSLTLPAGYGLTHGKPLADLMGVLSFGDKAYEIDAKPGTLPAGVTGVAPPVASTPGGGGAKSASTSTAAPGVGGVFAAIGLAVLGGLVLNLMPCVFPILSMKAASLARHAQSPQHARSEGLAFFVGTIVTFLVLAGLLIAARAGGQAVGWGFQLQSSGVVAALCLIMFAAGLNLSGVFEIGLSAQGVGSDLANRSGLAGAFFTGVLAVVVAAPCTAPFMAPAIGWALVQSPVIALSVFLALGVGLALPFTALSFAPALFRLLPPPGGWMEGLRKVLAFPMYAAAAWLAWVFTGQGGVAALPFLFAAAIALAFAAWCFGVGQRAAGISPGKSVFPRVAALVALVITVAASFAGAKLSAPVAGAAETASAGSLPTEPWSEARVAELQAAGKPVFVDFTAAWCVTCQVNERTALATKTVADAFAHTGAVYLKADWTRRDAKIANTLTALGRSGVPLYLVYGKAATPKILPQLLTPGVVVQALNGAVSGG
ncbi:MAG: protein-disulfide reductase DsbD family protein [Caulobacteraceae bacterium]